LSHIDFAPFKKPIILLVASFLSIFFHLFICRTFAFTITFGQFDHESGF
jgi:hypothetical protein